MGATVANLAQLSCYRQLQACSPIIHALELIALCTGAHAKVMDQDTDAEVARGIKAVLNTFPPLANGKDCATLPQIWRSRWGMDPLFLGSYSYMTGSSDFSDVDALAACIDDKLFFAGEAATSKYMGTMHGAYLTGQQAADALCQKFGHQGHSSQQ